VVDDGVEVEVETREFVLLFTVLLCVRVLVLPFTTLLCVRVLVLLFTALLCVRDGVALVAVVVRLLSEAAVAERV